MKTVAHPHGGWTDRALPAECLSLIFSMLSQPHLTAAAAVCTAWQLAALKCPAFWGNVRFDTKGRNHTEAQLAVFQSQMDHRPKDALWRFSFRCTVGHPALGHVLRQMIMGGSYLTHLELVIPHDQTILTMLHKFSAEQLRVFILDVRPLQDGTRVVLPSHIFLQSAPRLRTVSLSNVTLLPERRYRAFSNIVELSFNFDHISGTPMVPFPEAVFASCFALRTLELRGYLTTAVGRLHFRLQKLDVRDLLQHPEDSTAFYTLRSILRATQPRIVQLPYDIGNYWSCVLDPGHLYSASMVTTHGDFARLSLQAKFMNHPADFIIDSVEYTGISDALPSMIVALRYWIEQLETDLGCWNRVVRSIQDLNSLRVVTMRLEQSQLAEVSWPRRLPGILNFCKTWRSLRITCPEALDGPSRTLVESELAAALGPRTQGEEVICEFECTKYVAGIP